MIMCLIIRILTFYLSNCNFLNSICFSCFLVNENFNSNPRFILTGAEGIFVLYENACGSNAN